MHESLGADNDPIGWIKMYLGLSMMLSKDADNSLIGYTKIASSF